MRCTYSTLGGNLSSDDLDGMFESPHDAPPKWLCVLSPIEMYTAYLDETGQHTNGWIFVAGFLGNEDEWKGFIPSWKDGLGSQRKRLHMHTLRWNQPRTEKLLARLGPIPEACGLKAVAGGVNYGDYQELIEGTTVEKLSEGYLWCLFPLILCLLKYLPTDERVELIFGEQFIYQKRALSLLSQLVRETRGDPRFCTSDGLSKLAKWSFAPWEDTPLLDPSDYYASALANYHHDKNSCKTQWCMPILDVAHNMPFIGHILTRDEIRGQVTRGRQMLLDNGLQFYV